MIAHADVRTGRNSDRVTIYCRTCTERRVLRLDTDGKGNLVEQVEQSCACDRGEVHSTESVPAVSESPAVRGIGGSGNLHGEERDAVRELARQAVEAGEGVTAGIRRIRAGTGMELSRTTVRRYMKEAGFDVKRRTRHKPTKAQRATAAVAPVAVERDGARTYHVAGCVLYTREGAERFAAQQAAEVAHGERTL